MKKVFAAGQINGAAQKLVIGSGIVPLEMGHLGVVVSDVLLNGRRRFFVTTAPMGLVSSWLEPMRAWEISAN